MGDYNDAMMRNKDAAVQARTKAQNRATILQLKLAQKRARIHKIQLENGAIKAAEELQKYDPSNDPNISGDPYKTLFVAKLNYETTENRIERGIEREFEAYGPIKRVRLVADKATNKPRVYAFVEYMHTQDMKTAYKQADGRKLDNKRVLVVF